MDEAPCDRRVTMHGVTVQVRSQGQGPALLYLHAGDGLDKSSRLIESLADDFHVVAPSPPGFDDSGPFDGFRTVDDLSYLFLDLMEALELRDAMLVGASFGAWLAAEIAVKSQERIGRMVLINPVGIKIGAPDDQDLADIFYHTHRDVRRLLYADGQPDANDYGQVAADAVARHVRNREALTWYGWSPLLHNSALAARLHRIRVPALVLRAANDRVVSERYTRAYADAIARARLDVVPDAGHYVHDERPDDLARRIAAFASDPAARAAPARLAEEALP